MHSATPHGEHFTPATPLNRDSHSPDFFNGRRLWVIAMLLGATATALRLFAVWVILPQPFDSENFRAALALSKLGTLANPYALPTGPTAHVAPVYPFLLSVALSLTTNSVDALLWARSAVAIVFGTFVAALPFAARRIGLNTTAGLVAAVCFVPCGAPIFLSIEATGQSETPIVMMLFFGAMVATLASIRQRQLSAARAIALGLAWGLAGLSSPTVLPALFVTLALAPVMNHLPVNQKREMWRFSAIVALTLGTTLLPWTLRNYHQLGALTLVRDNFGLELAVSNSNDASADMRDNMRTTMLRHPFLSFRESALVAAEGEVAYNRRRGREAMDWISQHPARAATLVAERIGLFFYPGPARQYHAYFYSSVLILAALGAALVARRNRFLVAALLGTIGAIAAPYALVQSSPRYSYPVLWILLLFAGVTVATAFEAIAPTMLRRRGAQNG